MKLTSLQKIIVLIEIALIVTGTIIYFIVPTKREDFTPLWNEFNASNELYNSVSNFSSTIINAKLKTISKEQETIISIFKSNEAKYEELYPMVKKYIRDLNEIVDLKNHYEGLLKDCQTTKGNLNKWKSENYNELKKNPSINSKVNSSISFLNLLIQKIENATSEKELNFVNKKLVETKGIISNYDPMLKSELEKLSQAKTIAAQKRATKEQIRKREKREKAELAKQKAKEAEKKKEENLIKQYTTEKTGKTCNVKVVNRALPEYPDTMKEMGVEGLVKIKVTIAKDGSVKATSIIKSCGNDTLDYNAERAAKQSTYTSAYQDGKPIEEAIVIQYEFTAEE